MRLSGLEISNHSRIQDLRLDIRRHAVIVGANDVGKSSILRLLNLLLGASTGTLYQELTPSDLRDSDQPLVVNAWWSDFTEMDRRPFSSEVSIAADDQESESLWVQMSVDLDPDDDEVVTVRRWFPESGHDRTVSRGQLDAFGWRYLKATRGSSLIDGSRSPVRTLLAAAELGTSEEQLKNLLARFNEELSDNESLGDLLARMAGHLSRSMPRTVTQSDFAVRSATDPASDVLQDVTIFLNRGDEPVPLSEQSDGVRQLMSMTLFDLAEGAANVVAIDEPEIHLHPTSQRTAADLLSSGKNQKIIATHSPYVLHRFEPSEIIAVDRGGNCRQIREVSLSKIDKIRAHWWSPKLLEALTARFVVIVEGAADRVIVDAVAKHLGVDLDRIGAAVVELDGADKFRNVYPLLGPNGFGPTLLGLVDEKESASWLGTVGGKPKAVFDKILFVSSTDLEDEYAGAFGGIDAAHALIDGGFCSENSLLQAAGIANLSEITPHAVAAYCRNKGKVEAATCVADAMTPETAEVIGSVARLVRQLKELSAQ